MLGAGGTGTFRDGRTTYDLQVFVWSDRTHTVEVQAIYDRRVKGLVDPVTALVGTTLRLR